MLPIKVKPWKELIFFIAIFDVHLRLDFKKIHAGQRQIPTLVKRYTIKPKINFFSDFFLSFSNVCTAHHKFLFLMFVDDKAANRSAGPDATPLGLLKNSSQWVLCSHWISVGVIVRILLNVILYVWYYSFLKSVLVSTPENIQFDFWLTLTYHEQLGVERTSARPYTNLPPTGKYT